MSRSWKVAVKGMPKKPRRPDDDACQRRFSTRQMIEEALAESYNLHRTIRLSSTKEHVQ
jgi:hypothetical protein